MNNVIIYAALYYFVEHLTQEIDSMENLLGKVGSDAPTYPYHERTRVHSIERLRLAREEMIRLEETDSWS